MTNFSHPNNSQTSLKTIALVGNPNSGKSTLFNSLTGLNQKTGNFPGVTVDKKSGFFRITKGESFTSYRVIDLPGTYSLYPKSLDEKVTSEVLFDNKGIDFPDVIVAVADSTNLKRNLLLISQLIDLQLPVVLVLNMADEALKNGVIINEEKLSEELGIPVVQVNSRKNEGINQLKEKIASVQNPIKKFIDVKQLSSDFSESISYSDHIKMQIDAENNKLIEKRILKIEARDTLLRYDKIKGIITSCVRYEGKAKVIERSDTIDKVITHPFLGLLIFLGVLFIVFQSIFFIAEYPMTWIEDLFAWMGSSVSGILPDGFFNDLLVKGILAGLSGVVVFVPQIALLFGFISLLEDSGYMARVSFMMDKLMRQVGLNGRSVIPLISGVACAVPAIMGTRTISNAKERIITIMITPLMSCSARLPVYTLLISLLVPDSEGDGFFNKKGLYLFIMYMLGFVMALLVALVMKFILKAKERSFFIMELPIYRMPQVRTVGITMYNKVKVFLFDAGKIIIAVSIVLWLLSSYGPGDTFKNIETKYSEQLKTSDDAGKKEVETLIASEKLEASYVGWIGRKIEPAIRPLGFDWKIGISLITSLAAREVFVGTMATIYSSGDEENTMKIRDKMKMEINPDTGKKRYDEAVCWSLMIFYAFAMQCMSTLAVTYRETKSYKWASIQFAYMSVLAYVGSWVTYSMLS
ncbi:MAG: ferrous iron transport protein B [Bacteroidota bacterium]|nr:ferrous iron transport protein B [Bacteroidota bacterium]